MHPTEGELRAYFDDELSEAEAEWIKAHLATCAGCQQRADALRTRARWAENRLSLLAPEQPPMAIEAARARLALRAPAYPSHNKEKRLMKSIPFIPLNRPLWSGLAVAAVLLVALLFPPVRALATDFLGLFRVQRIEVVEVDSGDISEYMGPLGLLEQMFAEQVQIERRGDASDADDAERASTLAGFPVRLPTAGVRAGAEERQIRVQEGAQVNLTIALSPMRAVLRELGHSELSAEIALPDSVEGEQVTIEIPQAVTVAYGTCPGEEEGPGAEGVPAGPCVEMVQLPSPTVSAPPELDVSQLGAAYLQIMGLSQEEATRFSQEVDWSTTLVVPIPSRNIEYQEVQVDGVPGALFEALNETESRYLLLWVREGIVYALAGFESPDEGLTIANSLE
jgi:hypothetical protein